MYVQMIMLCIYFQSMLYCSNWKNFYVLACIIHIHWIYVLTKKTILCTNYMSYYADLCMYKQLMTINPINAINSVPNWLDGRSGVARNTLCFRFDCMATCFRKITIFSWGNFSNCLMIFRVFLSQNPNFATVYETTEQNMFLF